MLYSFYSNVIMNPIDEIFFKNNTYCKDRPIGST